MYSQQQLQNIHIQNRVSLVLKLLFLLPLPFLPLPYRSTGIFLRLLYSGVWCPLAIYHACMPCIALLLLCSFVCGFGLVAGSTLCTPLAFALLHTAGTGGHLPTTRLAMPPHTPHTPPLPPGHTFFCSSSTSQDLPLYLGCYWETGQTS